MIMRDVKIRVGTMLLIKIKLNKRRNKIEKFFKMRQNKQEKSREILGYFLYYSGVGQRVL